MADFVDCPFETQVIQALQGGQCSQELERHQANCEICMGVWLISKALRHDRELQPAPAVPAAQIWWKSQLQQRLHATRRADALAGWVHLAMTIAGVVVGNLLLLVPIARVLDKTVEDGSFIAFTLAGIETAVAAFAVIAQLRDNRGMRPS